MNHAHICRQKRHGDIAAELCLAYLHDRELAWRTKGVLTFLLAQPNNWQLDKDEIKARGKEGRDAIRKSLAQLEEHRYLHRFKVYENGKIAYWITLVFPYPLELTVAVLDDLFPDKCKSDDFVLMADYLRNMAKNPNDFLEAENPLPREREREILYHNNIYKDISLQSGKSASRKATIKERTRGFIKPAQKLAAIVKEQKDIRVSNKRIIAWANNIRLLHEEDGVPKGRIKKALVWLKRNAGGEYVPVVECGSTLRSKFLKLEGAMQRAAKDKPSADMEDAWQQFSAAWPKHKRVGIREAERVFYKMYNEIPAIDDLLEVLEAQKASKDWQKDKGTYIPNITRWLKRGSWADTVEAGSNTTTLAPKGIRVGHS